jgi:Uma2 family endonuclease
MPEVMQHSTVALPAAAAFGSEPRTRLWTRAEFYRMAEEGWFRGQRAELIEGRVMVQSPQKWLHASTVDRVAEVVRKPWPAGRCWVRMQLPISFGAASDPEPDVSVVAGKREDYRDHPTTALLLVEVSDSTLIYDQTDKASLYARSGIADYWIVNLVGRQLEVYRGPEVDTTSLHSHRYGQVAVLSASDHVTPLAFPQVLIPVIDLLG